VRAPDPNAPGELPGELTGGLPTLPVPPAALVTGGARRIGRALVLTLAEAGFAVAIHHHRSGAEADELVARIAQAGGRAVALAADLADEAAVASLLPQAIAALGPVGVLVNNASIFENDTVATASREGWDAHMAINLRAPFVLIQEYPARLPIYHFDAYRLTGPREFAELGVDEYFRGDGVCLVEWADKVEATLPAEHLRIDIAIVDENRRRFTITATGARYEQLLAKLSPS
jgi:tRNA threonylcarbamoyl adenosine modification protein YjeE